MPDELNISITKEQLSQLPVQTYDGNIVLIDNPDDVDAAVAVLSQHSVLGFDTETKPSFRKGQANKVALLQLATDECCYLFRLNRVGFSESLCRLLEDEGIVKIGLSVHDDFNVMHRSSDFSPRGFVELQNMVKLYHIQDISLQKVYAIIFGSRISKSQRLTNWEAQTLTPQQQRYAAIDAWACLRIYQHLLQGRFDPYTSPYIQPANDDSAATDNA